MISRVFTGSWLCCRTCFSPQARPLFLGRCCMNLYSRSNFHQLWFEDVIFFWSVNKTRLNSYWFLIQCLNFFKYLMPFFTFFRCLCNSFFLLQIASLTPADRLELPANPLQIHTFVYIIHMWVSIIVLSNTRWHNKEKFSTLLRVWTIDIIPVLDKQFFLNKLS